MLDKIKLKSKAVLFMSLSTNSTLNIPNGIGATQIHIDGRFFLKFVRSVHIMNEKFCNILYIQL